jgi:hypothetical protein
VSAKESPPDQLSLFPQSTSCYFGCTDKLFPWAAILSIRALSRPKLLHSGIMPYGDRLASCLHAPPKKAVDTNTNSPPGCHSDQRGILKMLVIAPSAYARCNLNGLLEYVHSTTTSNLRNLRITRMLRVKWMPKTTHAECFLKWMRSCLRFASWRHGSSRRFFIKRVRYWSKLLTHILTMIKISISHHEPDCHQTLRSSQHLIPLKLGVQSRPCMLFEKLICYLHRSDRFFQSWIFRQSLMPNMLYIALICNLERLKFIFSVAKYSPDQWVPTRRLVPNNQTITSQT